MNCLIIAPPQERAELDCKARQGETVVPVMQVTRALKPKKTSRKEEAEEGKPGWSKLEMKDTKRWIVKVGLALRTSQVESK